MSINNKAIVKIAALLLSAVTALNSYGEDWTALTDRRNVVELIEAEGRLWLATGGGLSSFDTELERFKNFTTRVGFSGVVVTAMSKDAAGGLWLAFDNRMIQRFDPASESVTHSIPAIAADRRITRINRIAAGDEFLYLATNRGIARVIHNRQFDRWVWLDEFTGLGGFSPEIPVVGLKVLRDTLWAVTAEGLAMGVHEDGGVRWRGFGRSEGLDFDQIRDIARFSDTVWVSTDRGVFNWNGSDRFALRNSRTNVMKLMPFVDAGGGEDSLSAIVTDGIYVWTGSRFERRTPPRNWLGSFARFDRRWWVGMIYTGSYRGGIVTPGDSVWSEYIPDGPITNYAVDIAFNREGDVALTGGLGTGYHGLSVWNGNKWLNWAPPEHRGRLFNYETRGVTFDLDGGVWVGAFGGGLGHFRDDGTVALYNNSPETGGRVIGYEGNLDYVLTPSLVADRHGNVWTVNRYASNGNVLVCIPRRFIQGADTTLPWIYFHRSLFRNYPHFDLLAIDGLGRKWIGSTSQEVIDGQGVYCFDDGGTLDDASDDRVWGPMPGLNYGQVLSISYDQAGYIWVGGLDGGFYINGAQDDLSNSAFTPVYHLRDIQVRDVAVDVGGNKWFATDFGVIVVAPDLFTLVRRITASFPDPLPSSQVQCIAINPVTGIAYIGTRDATIALQTPHRDFGETIQSLDFEPNPFNPNHGRLNFTGSSLAGRADVSIFTPDGRLVRRLTHTEAALGWDGRNDEGFKVASGVFLIVAHNDRGGRAQGKVAVIWK